ncbi:phosphatase PAP2 family protein, partial [Mycobacterium eburneum]
MWLGWRQDWGWLQAVDTSALTAAHHIGVKHHGWVQFWQVLCTVFSPAAFRLVGMVAVVAALVRRRVWAAVFLLVAVELSEVVSHVAKALAERPRPVTALVAEPSWSFPSGHALGVTAAVLALLTVLLPLLRPAARPAATAVGALIVVAVGVGRVARNVHDPAGVLAGW